MVTNMNKHMLQDALSVANTLDTIFKTTDKQNYIDYISYKKKNLNWWYLYAYGELTETYIVERVSSLDDKYLVFRDIFTGRLLTRLDLEQRNYYLINYLKEEILNGTVE